jgi:hypothetical protein
VAWLRVLCLRFVAEIGVGALELEDWLRRWPAPVLSLEGEVGRTLPDLVVLIPPPRLWREELWGARGWDREWRLEGRGWDRELRLEGRAAAVVFRDDVGNVVVDGDVPDMAKGFGL